MLIDSSATPRSRPLRRARVPGVCAASRDRVSPLCNSQDHANYIETLWYLSPWQCRVSTRSFTDDMYHVLTETHESRRFSVLSTLEYRAVGAVGRGLDLCSWYATRKLDSDDLSVPRALSFFILQTFADKIKGAVQCCNQVHLDIVSTLNHVYDLLFGCKTWSHRWSLGSIAN